MRAFFKLPLLWLILLAALPATVLGQTDTERFQTAMRSLKSMKKYGYQVNLSGRMPDGSYDAVKMDMYMDKQTRQVYYSDKANLVIINTKHILHIDHQAKVIKIFDRKAYDNKYNGHINSIRGLFRDDDFNRMIDSLFLKAKNVQVSRDKNGHTRFGLQTLKEDMKMQLEFSYDEQHRRPVSMDMTVGSRDAADKFVYTYRVSGYVFDFDDRVFRTQDYFTYTNNKYTVLQYRHYKLISGL